MPEAQALHEVAEAVEYVPAGQLEQDDVPYWPALHRERDQGL